MNSSLFEIVRINISNLGNCDRLDNSFSTSKSLEMNNETTKKIETMKIELEKKLEKIKNENAATIHSATSFSWLALIMIAFLFLFATLSDLLKCVSYFKENSYFNMKKQNIYKKNENNNLGNNGENVFRKVVEKDKMLFNHPFFRKNKKN